MSPCLLPRYLTNPVLHLVRQLQERDPNKTLTLNAGDYFQGTMWFNELGYEPVVTFSNMLNWTAMALGNHDFDLGTEDLAEFSK